MIKISKKKKKKDYCSFKKNICNRIFLVLKGMNIKMYSLFGLTECKEVLPVMPCTVTIYFDGVITCITKIKSFRRDKQIQQLSFPRAYIYTIHHCGFSLLFFMKSRRFHAEWLHLYNCLTTHWGVAWSRSSRLKGKLNPFFHLSDKWLGPIPLLFFFYVVACLWCHQIIAPFRTRKGPFSAHGIEEYPWW